MADLKRQVARGEYVFREGDEPDCAYLIDSGRVEVSTQQQGKKLVFSHLGPGDLLGEMAVIDDAKRSADALALADCELIEIRRDQIQQRLEETDSIIRVLVHALLQRYRSGLDAVRGKARSAKQLGKSDSSETPAALGKFKLESQLISAIENDELTVVFQPVFDVELNHIVGFEALTRWQHPERGHISPAEFIALAEETNLILPVGQYALRKACEALIALGDDFKEVFIAVNVSARQSAAPDFADMLVRTAESYGLPPERIELEITESLTLDYQAVEALIDRCHELGVSVALDDFGTGYSSLGHLHKLKFDVVKLDQAFTRQMMTDSRCMALTRGIATMIAAIGAECLAEGVETIEQVRELKRLGVRYLQGWHFGRPEPQSGMLAALTRVYELDD
jgi:EAL domain-containing protein (putative c-di-GMP-specific phosphodiesterase class I)